MAVYPLRLNTRDAGDPRLHQDTWNPGLINNFQTKHVFVALQLLEPQTTNVNAASSCQKTPFKAPVCNLARLWNLILVIFCRKNLYFAVQSSFGLVSITTISIYKSLRESKEVWCGQSS